MKKRVAVLLSMVLMFFVVFVAHADTNIHLTIKSDTQTFFDADQTVTPCESSPGSGTNVESGYCAVVQSGLTTDWSWYGTDGFLNSINGVLNDFSHTYTSWSWFNNLNYGNTSLSVHALTSGENLLVNYNINPLQLSVSNLNPAQHDTVTLTLNQFGLDSSYSPVWIAATSGTVVVNGVPHSLAGDGTFLLTLDFATPYVISGNESGYIDSNVITLNPTPVLPIENVLIRNGDTIIYQGTVSLPAPGTIDVVDDANTTHSINSDSVLGLLAEIASTTQTFSLSGIQYYAPGSFGPTESFYLKCLKPTGQSDLCQNWQYVVGNVTPYTSMDSTILTGGETIGIYFGSSHQVIFDTKNILTGNSFTATAQKYNYVDNTWSSLSGVVIGVTQPNPNDPWNPIVVASSTVDSNGVAVIKLSEAGTYDAGIADDYYFPSYVVTVKTPSSGGGGSGGNITPATFDVSKALQYLSGVQDAQGSFVGSSLYTDWAGIALAAGDVSGNTRTNIVAYLKSHNAVSSSLTENERRAITLLSLGQNPYSFNGSDYITPIVKSFDGNQFGDSSIDNDDIFALIPLGSAGYTSNDEIISKDISFILSRQTSNGSWDNSLDITAAAVMALKQFSNVSGVSDALTNASAYLSSNQGTDGGWGNVSSSSWVTQAMSALGNNWTKNGKGPLDYFAAQQISDGGVLSQSDILSNRVWATSYVIPAALGKSWNDIMQLVSKPIVITESTKSGGLVGDTSTTTATSTTELQKIVVATTTKIIVPVEISASSTTTTNKLDIETKPKEKKKIVTLSNAQTTQNLNEKEVKSSLRASVLDSGISDSPKPSKPGKISSFFHFIYNLLFGSF